MTAEHSTGQCRALNAGMNLIHSWRAVVQDEELNATDKSVLNALMFHANTKTGQCNPGMAKLLPECGLARITIIRRIDALEDAGYLAKCKRDGLSNEYGLRWITKYPIAEYAANCNLNPKKDFAFLADAYGFNSTYELLISGGKVAPECEPELHKLYKLESVWH